ncbi:MAG: PIN domain-containing protein [Promethearchaeota archaeon]|nr:MAG: PIN domain-containing protein [Candidatus Lokiarchaeota archaeon]
MAIFLDTGFYLGLIHSKDTNFDRAQELLREIQTGKLGQIYSSRLIMAETGTIVAVRTHKNQKALEKARDLFIGDLQIATILSLTESTEKKAWDIFIEANSEKKSPKRNKILSFVDCSNIILCKEHGIDNILAFDGDFHGWLDVTS